MQTYETLRALIVFWSKQLLVITPLYSKKALR